MGLQDKRDGVLLTSMESTYRPIMVRRSRAVCRILGSAGLAIALIAIPGGQAHAWSFDWFYSIFSSGSSRHRLPTKEEAIKAYSVFYTQTLINVTRIVPDTLWAAIKGGEGVTLAQRKNICTESGGKFASRLDTSPCRDGQVVVTPSGDSGLPIQTQSCNRGQGSEYSNICVYKDGVENYYWDDAPSIHKVLNEALPGVRNYIVFFWPAGQWHDYCYHHAEVTYEYTKGRCDSEFYSLMFNLCTDEIERSKVLSWYHATDCVDAAFLAREAVRKFGDDAWKATSSFVDYEGKRKGSLPAVKQSIIITSTYQSLLHRSPTAEEYGSALAYLQAGGTREGLIGRLIGWIPAL